MDKREFYDYIDAFNRNDFAGFSRCYTDDVILELPSKELRGRAAIVDFYKLVKSRVRETLQINQVILDSDGLAAELDTEFYGLDDWPEFIVAPLARGQSIRIVSFVHYRLRDGKFAHIKSARLKKL
jgi:hypothetical protein